MDYFCHTHLLHLKVSLRFSKDIIEDGCVQGVLMQAVTNFLDTTRCNIPEDTCSLDNLKRYDFSGFFRSECWYDLRLWHLRVLHCGLM